MPIIKRKGSRLTQGSHAHPPTKSSTTIGRASDAQTALDDSSSTDPILSSQQAQILERILKGENFFFTGSAGTGKSVLLRAIIRAFRKRYAVERAQEGKRQEEEVKRFLEGGEVSQGWTAGQAVEVTRWSLGVTASTGMAAV